MKTLAVFNEIFAFHFVNICAHFPTISIPMIDIGIDFIYFRSELMTIAIKTSTT